MSLWETQTDGRYRIFSYLRRKYDCERDESGASFSNHYTHQSRLIRLPNKLGMNKFVHVALLPYVKIFIDSQLLQEHNDHLSNSCHVNHLAFKQPSRTSFVSACYYTYGWQMRLLTDNITMSSR